MLELIQSTASFLTRLSPSEIICLFGLVCFINAAKSAHQQDALIKGCLYCVAAGFGAAPLIVIGYDALNATGATYQYDPSAHSMVGVPSYTAAAFIVASLNGAAAIWAQL